MNIEICSHAVLLGLLGEEPGGWDLLVVTNPDFGVPEGVLPLARRTLHLEFDDHVLPRPGRRLPEIEDVRRALEWAIGSANLVVACHAGVSRSSALAYVIRCRDSSPGEAIGLLTRGWHRPNERIVQLGAEVLGEPAVFETYANWIDWGPTRRKRRRR